jgi:hypothetical protein
MGFFDRLFRNQEKSRQAEAATREGPGIDPDLRDILARVETTDPVWKTLHFVRRASESWEFYPELESGKVLECWGGQGGNYEEWVLKNTGPWCILMTFPQNTEDGVLQTHVYSFPGFAIVCVELVGTRLVTLQYHDPASTDKRSFFPDHPAYSLVGSVRSKASSVTVQHLHDWVRQRVLPELEAAKLRREAERQQREAHRETMRKKYLP